MTKKAWNGGSIGNALAYAREQNKALISQGASLCDECGGEGGSQVSGVCIQCRGEGVLLPPGGLTLQVAQPVTDLPTRAPKDQP